MLIIIFHQRWHEKKYWRFYTWQASSIFKVWRYDGGTRAIWCMSLTLFELGGCSTPPYHKSALRPQKWPPDAPKMILLFLFLYDLPKEIGFSQWFSVIRREWCWTTALPKDNKLQNMQTCRNRQTWRVCCSWFLHVKSKLRNKFVYLVFIIFGHCPSKFLWKFIIWNINI